MSSQNEPLEYFVSGIFVGMVAIMGLITLFWASGLFEKIEPVCKLGGA